jgi:serine protease Do
MGEIVRSSIGTRSRGQSRRNSTWVCLAVVLSALLSAAPLHAVDPRVLDAETARVEMLARIAPSVVAVFAPNGDGGGSGVLISPEGWALSNFHVTGSGGPFFKCGLNDGQLYDAVLVGHDPTGDVSLIRLLGRTDFPAATIGNSDQVRTGDWVYALGNPFLLATDFHPTVTAGVVSGTHRYQYPAGTILEYTDCIQTDASINPGNSGGPLFNAAGELIGINGRGSFEKRGRVYVGAGYAISINQINHFLPALRGGRLVDHASLGATVRTGSDRDVLVDQILETSSAYRRGLREDDEIVSFAGRSIRSVNQFKNILGIYPDGWKVPLVYRREGLRTEILVELRSLHRESELAENPFEAPQQPAPPRPGRPKPGQPQPDQPPGQPSPGDQEKAPDDSPDDSQPDPHDPSGHGQKAVAPPAEWKHLFEARPGFVNYYFNRQEQQRVLAGLSPWQEWQGQTGVWKLTGKIEDDSPFVLTVADKGVGLSMGQDRVYLQPLEGSDPIDEPPGTGGLLMAVDEWKTLLSKGSSAFSNVTYLGQQPLDGNGPMVDVLETLRGVVVTRWYVLPGGTLLGLDSTLGQDVDPASLRWERLDRIGGRPFPNRVRAFSGDRPFAVFSIERLDVARSTSEEGVRQP